jgi:hypothetical protein
MVQWGELRALTSGTTSIYGAVTNHTCYRWLVRNVELSMSYNGFSGGDVRSNVLGIDQVNMTEAMDLVADMQSGVVSAYMIHVAEGVSPRAFAEFTELEMLGLLQRETVIIHGTALGAPEFARMAAAGTKLVWSPSSNLALYGRTTDVAAADAAGVMISIAPDWTPSGADEPLAELRVARTWLDANHPELFDDRELVERVTAVPAQVMAIDRHVGTLAVGKLADILVLSVQPGNPYSSVVQARPHDIRLVMIGGIPSYGDPSIVGVMRESPASCHMLAVCGTYKRACWNDTPDGPVSPEGIAAVIGSFYPMGPSELFACY